MGKKCLKCGYVRLETDLAPKTECPKCGIIYAKMEARHAQQRKEEFNSIRNPFQEDLKPSDKNNNKYLLGAFLVGGIAIVLFFVYQHFGAGSVNEYDGNYLASAQISDGERVDLQEHLIPGRYTIFFFYADW